MWKKSEKNVKKSQKIKKIRKPIISDAVVHKIIDAIKYDRTERDACRRARLPRPTYMDWKRKNHIVTYQFVEYETDDLWKTKTIKYKEKIWFADLIDFWKTHMWYAAGKILYRNIVNKKSWIAAIEYLKRRDKRYNDKIDGDITGKVQMIFWGSRSQFIKDPKKDGPDTDDQWWDWE